MRPTDRPTSTPPPPPPCSDACSSCRCSINNSAAHHTFVIKKSSTSASPLPRLSVCCVSLVLSLSVYFVRASERASERGCCSSSVATRERCAHATSIRVRERERERTEKNKRTKKKTKFTKGNNVMCAQSTIINHLLINPLIKLNYANPPLN